MLKLKEWNRVVEYAKQKCEGTDIKFVVYTMYDANKGIELRIFDSMGKFHRGSYSGIWDTFEQYKKHIDSIYDDLYNELY